MKKFTSIVLLLALLATMLCGCGSSYDDWHNAQVEKGMSEARSILGMD